MSRVRQLREARGLSQSAMGEAVRLTRQSIHAIESGRAVPAVDVALRLAAALDSTVEALFGHASTESQLTTEPVGELLNGRVAVAHIGGRWLSYALNRQSSARSADAIALRVRRGRAEVDRLRSNAELLENIVVMGCSPALGLLADRLNSNAGPGRFVWLSRSSHASLDALVLAQTHISGAHLIDAKTGEANLPDVRRLTVRRPLAVVTLARWEAGLVVARGNPKRITRVSQLANKDLRLVTREFGSGARQLLERELKRAKLPLDVAREAKLIAPGHLEVAQAVSLGAADVGMATRDAALAFGLEFVPLAEERYDLVVPRDDLGDPRLIRLFDVMTASAFRRELSSLGYDVEKCGDRVAVVPAN